MRGRIGCEFSGMERSDNTGTKERGGEITMASRKHYRIENIKSGITDSVTDDALIAFLRQAGTCATLDRFERVLRGERVEVGDTIVYAPEMVEWRARGYQGIV
jgi:hypothetical protein